MHSRNASSAAVTPLVVTPLMEEGDGVHNHRERTVLSYINPPDDRTTWMCPVCYAHYENPILLPCGHTMCHYCLPDNPMQCLICRADFTLEQLSSNVSFDRVVNKLVVLCPRSHQGCASVVRLTDLEHHLRECDFREVTCRQCGESVALPDQEQHLAEGCPMRMTECAGCGERVNISSMEEHLTTQCSNRKLDCAYAEFGCTAQPRANEMAQHCHDSECDHLELIRAQISQFRAVGRAQVEEAENKVAHLQEKVDDLSQKLDNANALIAQVQAESSQRIEQLCGLVNTLTRQMQHMEESNSRGGFTPAPTPPAPPVLLMTPRHLFASSRILTAQDSRVLAEFLAENIRPSTCECELLYRGTRDGFEAATFHRLCDRFAGTVVVVQTSTGNVFGGYASVAWNSVPSKHSTADPQAFIFSLRRSSDPAGKPVKILQNGIYPHKALYIHAGCGPVFGGGADFCVLNQANRANSHTNLGHTYALQEGGDRHFLNGGSYNFVLDEIEVFSCPVPDVPIMKRGDEM
ncbi:hypothetical protein PAPYR_10376 [Paratrimastix pyriformis]|uniref:Uncharacterized protein n=1 Tax=Paratrimastix pyriformis TaxID=342808 RepID=A0ABQ8U645_9EUKA|nr:hypothetical protein PAPYR_10376 [Paratrimastix pyriformis]|eukprot:GAFH01000970.1.p1 GENE.GAFH01000970.1~~GAFH01000970.1.p1  ORF type:complete len:520 (-),score=67.01 GAFH01000970.1:625-2184(-)